MRSSKPKSLKSGKIISASACQLFPRTGFAEASEAYKLLGDKVSLLEAVKGFLAVHQQRSASITFLDLFNRFIDAKVDRNKQYLRELRCTRDRFPMLHSRLASELTYNHLEPLLMAISPGGRNPVMRYLRAVFNYGIKRGFMAENPIAKLDFAERPRREVQTLSNGQVKAMLEHALEHDIELLPFLVLGIFCGAGHTASCKSCNGRTTSNATHLLLKLVSPAQGHQ
jgi:hypothetical protein